MVYRVAIERCWFRLLDAARRRIAESYIIAGSRFGRRDAPPAGRHVNLYVCGTGQWRVSYIRARCQYINWMICRPADPPFETVRLRDALSRRVKVNAGGGAPKPESSQASRRPSPHAMVELAHDHSHIPFPSCSKPHTRTHSHARTHGASNCQRGRSVCRANARTQPRPPPHST